MVERPIKKSDRQVVTKPSAGVEEVPGTEPSTIEGSVDVNQSSEEQSTSRPFPRKDKTKGRGKGNQQEDERSRAVSPALACGPKPTKPKPPVVKKTDSETAEDSVTEPDQETTAEG